MKVTIIGAGNVGSTLAKRIIEADLADVILLDIVSGLAQGKALDLLHAAPIIGYQKNILGTEDYKETKDSNAVVITAGFPRRPGMSRLDLIAKNKNIIKEAINNIKNTSPKAIFIVVTNPLDIMTYIAYKEGGVKKERLMGMSGVLDSSRFAYILARETKSNYKDIETMVLGQHGPSMVPLISHTKIKGQPLGDVISKGRLEQLTRELAESGSKIVNLLGNGSAYYAPSAACFAMIRAIINDEKIVLAASCFAEGEYGISDVCIGLPVKLGRNGIEEIVRLPLDKSEEEALKKSADIIKELIKSIP